MKTVTINKTKVKIFEEDDLIQKLGLSNKESELILKYQRTFPELLQEDLEGFVIDGEKLCSQLKLKDNFNTWLAGETRLNEKGQIKSQGKFEKYRCAENVDYSNDWDSLNGKFTIDEIKNMSPQQRSFNGIKNIISMTLECAKKISMRQNNDMGDLVCDYFILMEKALRNFESWSATRGVEKEGWKTMKKQIKQWCERKGFEDIDYMYIREANLLNESLTGFKASELRSYVGAKDEVTRDSLEQKVNKALDELQTLNTSLLMSDLDFDFRKQIIKTTCENKYSYLYINKI